MRPVKILRIFLLGLTVQALMNSCTMEKRVYVSGYQIEFKRRGHKIKGLESVSVLKERRTNPKLTKADKALDFETINNNNKDTSSNKLVCASMDNNNSSFISEELKAGPGNRINPTISKSPSSSTFPIKKLIDQSDDEPDKTVRPYYIAIVIAGFVFAVLGGICLIPPLFMFSWVFSIIGIIFCALMLRKKIKESLTKKQILMAKSGLFMGIIGLIANLAAWIALFIAMAMSI